MMHQIMFRTMIRRGRIERNASYAERNERRIKSSTPEYQIEKEKEKEKEEKEEEKEEKEKEKEKRKGKGINEK